VSALDLVLTVVRNLGDLRERVAFVGGAVRRLLITDPGTPGERPTDDVDFIVELASAVELHRRDLEARGFKVDTCPDAPICRRVLAGVRVDVMPTDGSMLGFKSTWYPQALATAIPAHVQGERFRIVNGPHFCATKLDSFADRGFDENGERNWYDHDLEDVVALVDGRPELLAEVAKAGADVRRYIAKQARWLLHTPAFIEALPGHLAGDSTSRARLPLVLGRLRTLTKV
jgi:hypothetical protein